MEVAAVDDRPRTDDLEARISELERRQRGGSARRESIETAFWAVMREVFPAQTRRDRIRIQREPVEKFEAGQRDPGIGDLVRARQ